MALAVAAVALIGGGAAAALAQTSSPSPSTSTEQAKEASRDAYLDDVASNLGISRADLDAALQAQALDEVQWKEDNGFITSDEAAAIRERITPGQGLGPHLGPAVHGPAIGGPPLGHRLGESSILGAAAAFLGMTETELHDALASSTLAEVAGTQATSVDGLKEALRDAKQTELDGAVADGEITADQEQALLDRFDSGLDDLVNGIPPGITDLASRLGVDRSRLIAAIRDAATAQVDAALADGLITQAQADAAKQRIEASPALPLGGLGGCGGLGFAGVPGLPGLGHTGFRPSGSGDEVIGA